MLSDILVYFVHAAVVLFAALTLWWLVSLAVKNASIIDAFWAFGFLIVALACLYLAGATPWRTFGHGEDKRYVRMRERSNLSEMGWRLRSLLSVFWGQGVLIMIVSAPIWIAMATHDQLLKLGLIDVFDVMALSGETSAEKMSQTLSEGVITTPIGLLAIGGAILWAIGFFFETVGDWQLIRFMRKHKGYNGPADDKPVLDTGLWKYTRHPNYFGNACMWWGIFLVACEAPWGWASIFGPLIMTYLLTRVSGKDLLEKDMGRRKNYQRYIERTSGFFPWPPKSKA